MRKYLKVWFQLAHISFAEQLATRFSSILFLIGKIARFALFLVFLVSLTARSGGLSGYTKDQAIVFFLVFNLADIFTQLFFRGVYFFRQKVVSGEFDFFLVKPMNPLFRIMAGYTDFLDLITLFALAVYSFAFFKNSSLIITPANLILFIVMLVFSFLIVPAICGVLLGKTVGGRLAIGWGIGVLTSLLGIAASYFWDLPTGAAVVCAFGLILLAVGVLRAVIK